MRLTVIAQDAHLSVNNLFACLIMDYQKQLNLVYTNVIINEGERVLARNAVTRIQRDGKVCVCIMALIKFVG